MSHHSLGKDDGWSEHGGYMRAKKTKLEKQFNEQSVSGPPIFGGVSIYVNGYTDPPASALRDLIIRHGGRYQAYYSRSSVTHVIASRLPYGKINKLSDEKLVTAHWITESISAGKLLPWQSYQLYATHRSGPGQKTLGVLSAIPADFSSPEQMKTVSSTDGTNASSDPITSVNTEVASCSKNQPSSSTSKQPRVQQMRVDDCLSLNRMPKAEAQNNSSKKITDVPVKSQITLKQLLNNKSTDEVHTSDPTRDEADSYSFSQTLGPQTSFKDLVDKKLATFYSRSRLHHLSSWAKDLHNLVKRMRENTEHVCDLGIEWYSQISNDLSPSAIDSKIIKLRARRTGYCDPNSYPLSIPERPRIIFHIDMDCFFVSVALRSRPALKDKPVVITHAKGSGGQVSEVEKNQKHIQSMSEIASCSYAARVAGVKNGMLLGRAKQLCPDLIALPYEFGAYKTVSEILYNTVARFTRNIQAVSCDELYADCTELLTLSNKSDLNPQFIDGNWEVTYQIINPLTLGSHLRELVKKITGGCTASIGFGTSKLLARLATKKAKPDGQTWFLGHSGGVCPSLDKPMKVGSWRWYSSVEDLEQIDSHPDCELTGEAYQWFSNLPVIEMPNIGRSLAGKIFQAFNAKTCGELMLKVSHSQITNLLGKKTGNRIYLTCHGKDFDSMRFEKEYKSVSASMNYGIRLKTQSELEALVCSLCEELSSRMANVNIGTNNFGCLGKSLTIRLYLRLPTAPEQSAKFMGHGLCSIKNHTIQMAEYTSEAAVFFRYAVKAVHRLCPEPQDLRGIGFHVHQLHGVSTKADILTNADVNGNCKPVKHSSQLPASHQPQCLQSSSDYSKVHRKWDTMDVRKSSTVEYDISGILRTMEKTNQAIEEQKADVSGDANEVMSTTSVKPKNNNSEVCKRSPTKRTCRGPPVVPVDKRSKTNHREFNCSDASRQKLAVAFENSTGHETSQVGCLTQALENPSGLFVNKTLSELQQIFADWITSEEVPMYEDIQILTDYLLSLVDTNLERIRSVLLLLDRLITKLAQISDSWRNAYIKMHNTLSQSIEEKYSGSSLKLRLA